MVVVNKHVVMGKKNMVVVNKHVVMGKKHGHGK